MSFFALRFFFFLICAMVSFQIGSSKGIPLIGLGVGIFAGLILIVLEWGIRRVSIRGLSSLVFGLVLGILIAKLTSDVISLAPIAKENIALVRVVLTVVFAYLCSAMALRGKDEFNLIIPYVRFKRQDYKEDAIVLDTSSIIDGRIVDIYKTRFLESRLILPSFVLKELQNIADSSDAIKRQRGRRGLDMLQVLQKDPDVDIRVYEEDISGGGDVDSRLVKLAKILEAKIATTDFNLNKVATLQGVKILNVNELANALKPVVFPGESMEVRLIKEGKEHDQAVAYLNDGTMIVVEDSRKLIGQLVKVSVTSVLQTQAGRMIFAKLNSK